MDISHRKFVRPDKAFRRLSDISVPYDIAEAGVKLILLDIDGTVKNRLLRRALPDTREWIRRCREHGVYVCLISNDRRSRHVEFAEEMDLPMIAAAGKPSPIPLRAIMDEFGCRPESTVMVGNNPFTDILAAHRAGIRGYLVRPIETTRLRKEHRRRRLRHKRHID